MNYSSTVLLAVDPNTLWIIQSHLGLFHTSP